MTRDDRCPVCDRPLASVVDGYPATGKCRRRSRHAIDVADCDANAVDWREYCQAAEAERDEARDKWRARLQSIEDERDEMLRRLRLMMAEREMMERERDEARAEADAAMWAHAESLAISDMCSMAGGPERTSTEHLRAEYPQHAERLLAERTKTDVK